MAIDSKQKRESAIHVTLPWRGPMVDAASLGFPQSSRQAAAYMYSGLNADVAPEPEPAAEIENIINHGPRRVPRRSHCDILKRQLGQL